MIRYRLPLAILAYALAFYKCHAQMPLGCVAITSYRCGPMRATFMLSGLRFMSFMLRACGAEYMI